jgi:large subunit ribosomal protein L25
MAAKDLQLSVERRERVGTTNAHKLRAAGKVPAVLYGHGSAPEHLAFEARAFDELLHKGGRTGIITLMLNGKKGETALVRDISRHQVSRQLLHVDLQRVSATEAVRANVPVVTTGTARGVKDFAGVMDVLVHDVEIEGPANQLPDHVEIDVTDLGIHEHATAADIRLPRGFKMLTPGDTIVVSIETSKTARHLEEAEAAPVPEQAQPEVIGAAPEGETT